MADGGYDLEMEPIPEMSREEWDKITGSKIGKYDDNPQYNNGDNLSSDPTFTRPPVATELIEKELTYVGNEDKLKNALEGTGWKYTNTGLTKLSSKIILKGNKLFYHPERWEVSAMTDKQMEDMESIRNIEGITISYILPLTKSDGKFYSEKTLMKYGARILNQIKGILGMPEENIPMVNQIPPSVNQPQATTTAETSFTENIVNSPKPIDRLIDATEDELKSLGFTDNAIREWKSLIKSSDDLAAVKRDKDMIIEELEKRLADLKEELLNTTGDNFVDKTRLEKKIEELTDKLIIEHKKVFDLDNERESKLNRLRRLITDVLKNPDSRIPLKDRLKLLFKLEGFTIAAVIATITMFFTTIGLAISNSLRGGIDGGGGSGGGGGDKPPSIPDRVREGLKKLAEWLKELAKKSVLALPGFIGSIVSFLLKSTAAAVGFLAEHLIILIFMVVSSLIYGLIEGMKTIKKSYK